jgi:hypothetical protein
MCIDIGITYNAKITHEFAEFAVEYSMWIARALVGELKYADLFPSLSSKL